MKTTSEKITFLTQLLGYEKLKEEISKRRASQAGETYISSAVAIEQLYQEHSPIQSSPKPKTAKVSRPLS